MKKLSLVLGIAFLMACAAVGAAEVETLWCEINTQNVGESLEINEGVFYSEVPNYCEQYAMGIMAQCIQGITNISYCIDNYYFTACMFVGDPEAYLQCLAAAIGTGQGGSQACLYWYMSEAPYICRDMAVAAYWSCMGNQ